MKLIFILQAFTRVLCKKCNTTFANRNNLLKHERYHHRKNLVKLLCPVCDLPVARMDHLADHHKRFHPNSELDRRAVKVSSLQISCSLCSLLTVDSFFFNLIVENTCGRSRSSQKSSHLSNLLQKFCQCFWTKSAHDKLPFPHPFHLVLRNLWVAVQPENDESSYFHQTSWSKCIYFNLSFCWLVLTGFFPL